MFRGPVPLDEKEERGLQRLGPLRRPSLRKGLGLRLLSRFKPLDSTSNSSRPSTPTTKSTLRSETSPLSKLSNHLWDVSEELVGLSFFDSDVSCGPKPMVTALRREEFDGEDTASEKVPLQKSRPRSPLEDFVSGRTLHFFRKGTPG
ncbi:hypothetical protein GWK47_031520 [Chionoecetes opilio]|uniref:Uncharacterized protein n=1 Tax=Chionoecetes opilio TaxID=41210 RepID=A0A8J4YKB9_CHIOP|nr:hypothetical protein GWK47_031520 [Chionoecetes opilio]